MRLSKTSRWILIVATFPLACVLIYLALPLEAPEPRTPPPYISLGLVGYTVDASSNILGRFIVSNVSGFNLRTGPGFMYNFMTNGTWPPHHHRMESPVPLQVLKPGGVLAVTVPVPTNKTPWRLRTGAERLPNGFEKVGLTLRRVLPARFQCVPDTILYERDRYTGWTATYSGPIEPQPVPQPQDEPDNVSQLIRSETNHAPSAAGSP